MSSIFYKHSLLYNTFLRMIHGKKLKERYKKVSELVGKNKRVLDLACGTSKIIEYLDDSCSYEGWDLNKSFINYSKKKGLSVKLKNVLDFQDYPENDVILIIDFLHHICPDHDELVDKVIEKTRKLIIVEPYTALNPLYKSKFFKKLIIPINILFGDYDGINSPKKLNKWSYEEKSLKKFFRKKGAEKIINSGMDLIAVINNE